MRTRSIRTRGQRKKKSAMEIEITSLLDILVILLVFLIKNYDASNVVINVPKEIKLAPSVSMSYNTKGVVVQASPNKIWVDDKEILDFEAIERKSAYDDGNRRIVALYDELVKRKQEIEALEKVTPELEKFNGVVNLVIDKTLEYTDVKRLMYTAAEAGFRSYKFVVLGPDF